MFNELWMTIFLAYFFYLLETFYNDLYSEVDVDANWTTYIIMKCLFDIRACECASDPFDMSPVMSVQRKGRGNPQAFPGQTPDMIILLTS